MDNLIIKQNEIDNKLKIIEDKLLKHFTCDICGKVSISLGLHGRHMRDIHTDSTYNDKWIVMTDIKKQLLVDKIFKPNELGISVWIERSEWEGTGLDWGNNGDGRNGIYFGDKRFNWEVKRGKKKKKISVYGVGFNFHQKNNINYTYQIKINMVAHA